MLFSAIRWGVATALLAVAFACMGSTTAFCPMAAEERGDSSCVTLIVDGMMKSRSGAT